MKLYKLTNKFSLLFLAILILSCFHKKPNTIKFINKSHVVIDSVEIAVSSKDEYKMKFLKINPLDSVFIKVPDSKPEFNGHDITISLKVYPRGKSLIYDYSYSDLPYMYFPNYRIILDDTLKLNWQAQH